MSSDVAVNFRLEIDRESVSSREDTEAYLVARCVAHAPEEQAEERPALSVVFVLDVSGSMAGPPLAHVCQSVERLLGLLTPDDRVGLVTFSDRASVVAEVDAVSARWTGVLKRRLSKLEAGGGTNIEEGLRKAARALGRDADPQRGVVLLLSDGAPNQGEATASGLKKLARKLRKQGSISTLGFGQHHQEDVLAGVADGGGGTYRFIPDPTSSEAEFAMSLGAQGDVAADSVELVLRPAEGVELVKLLDQPDVRFTTQGLVIPLPDLRDGVEQLVVGRLEIQARPDTGRPRMLAVGTLKWRSASAGQDAARMSATAQATAKVTEAPGAPKVEAHHSALLALIDEVRSEARGLADRGNYDGAAAMLRKLMAELAKAPGFEVGDTTPLAEAYELLVDEATAMERRPDRETYLSFKRNTMHLKMAYGDAQVSEQASRTMSSISMLNSLSQIDLLKMELVVIQGPNAGQRWPLQADQILGRTPSCDIQLPTASASRRHAKIIGQHDGFSIVDLGSTNTTRVNGQPVRGVRKLNEGDIIGIGEFQMRFVKRDDA